MINSDYSVGVLFNSSSNCFNVLLFNGYNFWDLSDSWSNTWNNFFNVFNFVWCYYFCAIISNSLLKYNWFSIRLFGKRRSWNFLNLSSFSIRNNCNSNLFIINFSDCFGSNFFNDNFCWLWFFDFWVVVLYLFNNLLKWNIFFNDFIIDGASYNCLWNDLSDIINRLLRLLRLTRLLLLWLLWSLNLLYWNWFLSNDFHLVSFLVCNCNNDFVFRSSCIFDN